MPIAQRSCPNCGAGVGLKRLWLLNGWAMEWTCPSCSRRLKFSSRRKLQLEVLRLPIMAGYAYALVRHEWWMALGVFALMIPLARLDSVVMVEEGRPDVATVEGQTARGA